MMKPATFETRNDPNATGKFVKWQRRTPSGFVVNCKTGVSGMIHCVGCFHLGAVDEWVPEWGDLTKNPKVCHPDRGALEEWASTRSIRLEVCGHCFL